jgi:hypothetical protein
MATCTRCKNTGFLNTQQLPADRGMHVTAKSERDWVLKWIEGHEGHDVQVCDCCGDGEEWYGEPGEHYGPDDPPGPDGPYEYNGGLCECN